MRHQVVVTLTWEQWLTLFSLPLGFFAAGLLGLVFAWKYLDSKRA